MALDDGAIPSPARPTDPRSSGEPPDLLFTALLALLFVVAAVCMLAVIQSTFALIVAVTGMLVATLLVTFVIVLHLEQ